ncbi:MAG: PAS domain S-box protein [Betaproteobacteria bacterium]
MNGRSTGERKAGAPQPYDGDAYRLMVEGVRDYAIFMLNPDGVIATWNEGAQRIKGYAASEIIGQHFSRFYTADALAKGWPDEELRRARELGRFEDESWRIRKDGSRFWANVIITALHNEKGELIGFSKITRDLTDRRAHEELLRQSEEHFRLLVEGVKGHAIFLVDPDGVVMNWNAGAERVLGFRSSEVVGRDLSLLYIDEDVVAGRPEKHLANARDAGYAEDMGWRLKSDGTRLWAESTITALRDRDGTLRGFATIVRDLSERRRVQELETEGKRINEFIAMLAHELRNPLAPISNAVRILEKTETSPEVERNTQLIARQVGHLSRLVDDLLDVSRITSGKIRMRKEPLELNALVQAAVESVRPAVEGYGHTIEMQPAKQPLHVDGDDTRLTQVVVNLVTNAAKYTPRGGRVRLELLGRGSIAVLRVIDNGLGMTKALMDSVFELFVQGDRALDRAEGGLGVGLTLVKRIVTMHGGTIGVTSAGPDQGSEFTVTLPLSQHAGAEDARQSAAAPSKGARKILVVDDNEDAANSLAALLRMLGHEVLVVHDGPDALISAVTNPPDTVLLDLGLPKMNGYEVARRLRALPHLADARLVAVTGYGQEDDRRAAREAGFNFHLVKPVEFDELLRVIGAKP